MVTPEYMLGLLMGSRLLSLRNGSIVVTIEIHWARGTRNHTQLRRYHLISELVDRGDVKICKVHTDLNVADPLTKPLTQPKLEADTRAIGIRYLND